jgi:hypothetical protein
MKKTKSNSQRGKPSSLKFVPGRIYHVEYDESAWFIGLYRGPMYALSPRHKFELLVAYSGAPDDYPLAYLTATSIGFADHGFLEEGTEYSQNFEVTATELQTEDLLLYLHGQQFPLLARVLKGKA